MFDIRIYGDPVLRKTARRVTSFDDELKRFAKEMVAAMREKDGVGLAAIQIGRPVKLAVVDTTGGERDPFVLINPEIVFSSET
ncbi:MAG: peptide deformylase, partial [Chitinispirillaceae bacterium]